MNPALVAVAAVVVGGGVLCLAGRDARLALAGLSITLLFAPLLSDPLPTALELAARAVASILATYLIWIVVRDPAASTRGSLLGWPVEALMSAAAFAIGFGTAGLGAAPLGPAEAQGAGFALVALSVGPIVFGRDVVRLGSGALLLVGGVLLVRVALAGAPTPLEQLVTGVLFVGLGGAVAFLASQALAAGAVGGAVLDPEASGVEIRSRQARGR